MPELKDNVRRVKQSSLPGTTVWVGLRALDPFLQYGILSGTVSAPVLSVLRGSFLAQGPTSSTGLALLDNLQLSPYRLALLAMTVGSSLKHVFWKLAIAEQYMPPADAGMISAFNTVFNSLSTFLFVNRYTSPGYGRGESPSWPGWPGVPLTLGSILFVTGITLETVSEVQRAAFKKDPKNKGKPYTGGLFALARHINYGGYTLWRAGLALAGGGYAWGLFAASFFSYDFINRGIPVLDAYCQNRYADMWNDYKEKTPYKFLPFIY